MRLRLISAIVIFLGSYFPLSLILLVQDYDFSKSVEKISLCTIYNNFMHLKIALSFFIICLTCFLIATLCLFIVKPKQKIILTEVKYVPADLINYTLPYVVSFMNLSYQDPEKLIGFFIFLCWMFLISYKSGQVIFNPVLIVLGWRLYDVKFKYSGGDESIFETKALTKELLEPRKVYRHCKIQEIAIIDDTKEIADA